MTAKPVATRRFLLLVLAALLALTPFLGASAVYGQEGEGGGQEQPALTIAGLEALIAQLYDEGAFKNYGVKQSLTSHLNEAESDLDQGDREAALLHMEQFSTLLNNRYNVGHLTEDAYNQIKRYAEGLVKRWSSLAIVQDGQALAVILIADGADAVIEQSAQALLEYVQKSTGAVLPIFTFGEWQTEQANHPEAVRIYVGTPAPGTEAQIDALLTDLDVQGFVIHPGEDHVSIVGPTVFGTRNGVYDFLERYLDIRWLMPGPDGEDVPPQTELLVFREDVVEEPAFTHRVISAGLQTSDWWVKNRLQLGANRTIKFQENLYSLFPPEKYAQTHPEFYPKGIPPAPGENHTWQPCFTVEGTVEAAAQGIIEYFNNNPNETSYSLGINDSRNFCEADPNHPDYPGKLNSVGDLDMSEIYYNWVNQVVELVLQEHPDKWFGLLAYNNVTDPPSFPLHPRVVPFITKDRLTWIDDDIRNYGQSQLAAWRQVANQVGWYDYMYGTLHLLPRIFPHVMAENFKYAYENNVYGHYIEMYNNIGDGPKGYIAAKLMWDPYQDVDALMDEWYERMVGPEAAEDLKTYFERWEEFWTGDRIKNSNWFQNGKTRTYLPFTDVSYLSLVTEEDLTISRQLLESVLAKTQTPVQQKRAEAMLKMFEYYEATVRSYPGEDQPNGDRPPLTESEALALFYEMSSSANLAQKRYDLMDEFEGDLLLKFHAKPRVHWTGWNGFHFWDLVDYLLANEQAGGPVTDAINQLAEDDSQMLAKLLKGMLTGSITTLTDNHSFETGDTNAPPWTFWNPLTSASIERVEGIAHSGNASIKYEGAERAGVYMIFPVKPGLSATRVHYYSPPGTEEGGVRIVITLRNASGRTIADYISATIPLKDTAGRWASIGLLEMIPTHVNNEEVKEVLLNAQVWNAQGAQVYLDDVEFYQVETPREPGPVLLTQNSSFESGGTTAPPWGFWLSSSTTGTIQRVTGVAHTGNASLLVDHLDRGGPIQTFAVEPGKIKAKIHYYTPEGTTTNGQMRLGFNIKDQSGATLTSLQSPYVPLAATAGEWAMLEFVGTIPAEVNGVPVKQVQVVATVDKAQDTVLYLDDFEVAYVDELTVNSSFENGDLNSPPWTYWLSSSTTGTIYRTESFARTGNASLLIDHLDRGGPVQVFQAQPGTIKATAHYYTPEGTTTNGTIQLVFNVKNASNANLLVYRSELVKLADTAGEWSAIELEGVIPAEVNGEPVTQVQVVATIDKAQDTEVYIDDFSVNVIR